MSKLSEKLDNFWYHYKWHTVVALFFIVVFGVCIGQMASKDKVDAYVMYAGPTAFLASEIEDLQSAFEAVMPDLNGDGKKVVQFIDVTVLTDARIKANKEQAEKEGIEYKPDMEFIYNSRQKYKLQLAAGDAYFLLVDPEVYAEDYGIGMFEKLSKLGLESDDAYDDSSVVFKNTDFGSYMPIFDKLPDDTLLTFRAMNVTSKGRGEKEQAKYDDQLELFKKVIEFELSGNA